MNRPCIIPLGARGLYETIVSQEDYAYLTAWRWNYKRSRGGNVYARRRDSRTNRTVLMHVVIMERKGEARPSDKHTPDHLNRNSLDNQRGNLEWATPSQQNRNRRRRLLTICTSPDNVHEIPF